MPSFKKKLIEVALPLDAINKASAREKSIRHGHPSTLHLWWARRPLAAARAVIFAQMVDDPSANPDLFPTEKAQEKERQRLFGIIEDLVQWENTNNEEVLERARAEIWQSWRRACAENADHPRAGELFDRHQLPAFHDPFAGGGSLPLEAQRLGLEAHASDLNPVAVLINKAMIEIPPKFAGMPPVNPGARSQGSLLEKKWKGAEGLAEDVRYYGKWMRDEAEKRIGHLYPKVEITVDMAENRPDLRKYVGQQLTVIAWLWARTVKSPNPAFTDVEVPLLSTSVLSSVKGREVHVVPIIEGRGYRFAVELGKAKLASGTRLGRGASFRCVMSNSPITGDYIRNEGRAGRLGARLLAIVAAGDGRRVYLPPTKQQEEVPLAAEPEWRPDIEFLSEALGFRVGNYGMTKWSDLFTTRQLTALASATQLVDEARGLIEDHAATAASADTHERRSIWASSAEYADAVQLYLAFAVDKTVAGSSTACTWMHQRDSMYHTFSKQTLSMTWDFAEVNVLASCTRSLDESVKWTAESIAGLSTSSTPRTAARCLAHQANATTAQLGFGRIFSTDPPYYDNVGYADLSDFFYVWLRRSLQTTFPDLLATLTVPKADELVATPARHGSKSRAESFFLSGMTQALRNIARQTHPSFPTSIYYAFKQAEQDGESGRASTGWETFLGAAIEAGFAITGTMPIRTEREVRTRGIGSNALASSIVLVCRKRHEDSPTATRRQLVAALRDDLPEALRLLQIGNIAPVDLAQAAIGPGMAVFTRYSQVLDAEGRPLTVRDALALINQVLDEVLAEQEGDFDADTRWALAWFEQYGFAEADFGVAETLSKAKNTSVDGMRQAGLLASSRGRVRLLRPEELPAIWDPGTDARLTTWEMVHQLIRALAAGGEAAASDLVRKLGAKAEVARELAYRLYTVCERKKRAVEALAYNGLVQSWPEIARLAREMPSPAPALAQGGLFDGGSS
jgi:putative DNA methylase